MVMQPTLYNCNYTTNIYTKSKKWNTGILKARSNHGSVTLTLHELDEKNNSCGKLIDKFDIFNASTTTLAGREFITGRNLIDVHDFFGKKYHKQPTEGVPAPKPKIRAGLQRSSKPSINPYDKKNSVPITPKAIAQTPFKPTFSPQPTELLKPEHNLPTSNLNVNDIIKNIELMLDDG